MRKNKDTLSVKVINFWKNDMESIYRRRLGIKHNCCKICGKEKERSVLFKDLCKRCQERVLS